MFLNTRHHENADFVASGGAAKNIQESKSSAAGIMG